MNNQNTLKGQTVQSTMLLALYGRAKASGLFPDVLRDTEAERIVGGMDYDFSQIDETYGTEYACLCCLVRAKRLDERCEAYIKKHPDGTVVNLGFGLDTTFSRVDNGAVRWYNVDLPDAVAFRQRFIPPAERAADIAKSMFDYTWLDDVKTADGSVFALAGGVFCYFEEARVRELVRRVSEHFPYGEIFFDAQPKTTVRISNRMVRKTGNKGAEMRFWVNDLQALKKWSKTIRKVERVPFFGNDRKNGRYKLSTTINMWGLDRLGMGFLVSVQWGPEE
jgi:O-methyltransferase involved in polyketide biosynthesis